MRKKDTANKFIKSKINKTTMREEYRVELMALQTKMEEAEEFAKTLPIFEREILENKYTGNEQWLDFGRQYKRLPLEWGIKRGFYKSGGVRTVTNYHSAKKYSEYLFNIYINCTSLFGEYVTFGLDQVHSNLPIFFYDKLNSTFYATDDQITALLEALNTWYIKAAEEMEVYRANQKIAQARKEIENQNALIEKLTAK